MASKDTYVLDSVKSYPATLLRGVGQVMFQDNAWTGLLFLIGIFWGAYEEHLGIVAWGALVGVVVSTLTGYILKLPDKKGANGLWGFNGVLVGCAFPTFMGNTIWMWLAMILCSAMTTFMRTGMDRFFSKFGVTSYTFPFVVATYFFLLSARLFGGIPAIGMNSPEFPNGVHEAISLQFGDLVVYWLKGLSQVFLINSWVTGIFFLAALAVSSWRAALWAGIGSALSLFIALVWQAPGKDIADGLYGFSAVLTAIAIGATFCNFSWKSAVWALIGIIATVFIQAGMNTFFAPMGLPTLTGPFCIATWIFLIPQYKQFLPKQE